MTNQNEEPMLFGSLAAVDEFLQRLTRIEATQKAHDEAIRRIQERVRRLLDAEERRRHNA